MSTSVGLENHPTHHLGNFGKCAAADPAQTAASATKNLQLPQSTSSLRVRIRVPHLVQESLEWCKSAPRRTSAIRIDSHGAFFHSIFTPLRASRKRSGWKLLKLNRSGFAAVDALSFIINRRGDSQAGRRGFESRLPLHSFQLTYWHSSHPPNPPAGSRPSDALIRSSTRASQAIDSSRAKL